MLNRKKVKVILYIVLFVLLLRILFLLRISLSEEYSVTKNFVSNSLEVVEKLGVVEDFGFFPSGRIKTVNSKNYSVIKLKVFGSKKEQELVVFIGQNEFNEWELDEIQFLD